MGILVFIFGLLFGSFYLVVGTRLPLKDNIVTGRSRCDHCKHELAWYELIPIFSYCFQLGKCNYCHEKISPNHLIWELVTATLFLVGYLYYGLTYNYYIYLIILSVGILIFISDFKYMIILDSPLIIGSILIIIIKIMSIGWIDTLKSVASGAGLFLLMYLVSILGKKMFKKEALGGGDIKLAFLMGLTLNFQLGLIALIFASFLALPYALAQVYLNKKNELPYGPFLIASTVIIFVFIEKFSRILILFSLL